MSILWTNIQQLRKAMRSSRDQRRSGVGPRGVQGVRFRRKGCLDLGMFTLLSLCIHAILLYGTYFSWFWNRYTMRKTQGLLLGKWRMQYSRAVSRSPSFRFQASKHIAPTVLPWNGEAQKGWHAGEVMLWFHYTSEAFKLAGFTPCHSVKSVPFPSL